MWPTPATQPCQPCGPPMRRSCSPALNSSPSVAADIGPTGGLARGQPMGAAAEGDVALFLRGTSGSALQYWRVVLARNIRPSRQHHPRALRRGLLLPDRLDRARALLVRTAPTPHPHAAASQSVLLRHPADSRLCQWSVCLPRDPTVAPTQCCPLATPSYYATSHAPVGSVSGSSTARRALPGRARLVARASSSSSSCTLNPKAKSARPKSAAGCCRPADAFCHAALRIGQ